MQDISQSKCRAKIHLGFYDNGLSIGDAQQYNDVFNDLQYKLEGEFIDLELDELDKIASQIDCRQANDLINDELIKQYIQSCRNFAQKYQLPQYPSPLLISKGIIA